MPSSRRSSRSYNPLYPQTWRAHNSVKKSASAIVSLVVAEPEQGAPLAPAQALISTQIDTLSIHSSDNVSTSERVVTSKPSIATLCPYPPHVQEVEVLPEAPVLDPVSQQNDETRPDVTNPTSEFDDSLTIVAPSPKSPPNDPNTLLPSATPPIPSPARYSWLGTFRRIKAGRNPSQMSIVQTYSDPQVDYSADPLVSTGRGTNSSTSPPHQSHHHVDTFEHPTRTSSSLQRPNSLHEQAINDSNLPPPAAPATSPPNRPNDTIEPTTNILGSADTPSSLSSSPEENNPPVSSQTEESLPSSIEVVPTVKVDLDFPPPSLIPVTPVNKNNATAFEAPSSRFTLTIPFFGRAKSPIESVSKSDEKDGEVEPVTQAVKTNVHDLSLPLPVTITPFADAAGDSLQNAVVNPPKLPSITAEQTKRPNSDLCQSPLPQASPDAVTEELTAVVQTQPSNVSWWSYLASWSASNPQNPTSSFSPHENASMSNPPSGSPESDSRSDTGMTNSLPSSPAQIVATTGHGNTLISPTTLDTTPSKSSETLQTMTSHAIETRKGVSAKPTIAHCNNVSNATEAETLPRTLDSQERNSAEAQQRQSESAEQINASTSSNVPPTTGWLAPWSWYSHSNNQVPVGPRVAPENGHPEMGMGTHNIPAGVVNEPEDELEGMDEVADVRKRTSTESDGENQAVVESTQGQNAAESSTEKGKAGIANVPDTAAEVTVSSDEGANPIEQSISAYRSGWASFFSSRRLIVKTLGSGSPSDREPGDVKRDENGMEVMEVDFEEDATSADKLGQRQEYPSGGAKPREAECEVKDAAAPPGSLAIIGGPNTSRDRTENSLQNQPTALLTNSQDTIQETLQSKSASNKKSSSAPCSKPGSRSTTPIPIPLTPTGKGDYDPSTRSTTTPPDARKRTASPAPSLSSKKVPPNLVLPTWEDTFHAPPRSVIPRSETSSQVDRQSASGKLLGRAMGFVNDVLFSKAGTGTDAESKFRSGTSQGDEVDENIYPPDREREERFQLLEKGLPRAWDIIERDSDMSGPMTRESGGYSSPLKLHNQSSRCMPWRFMSTERDKAQGVIGPSEQTQIRDVLHGCKRVVVIGIHGWFPGAVVRTVLGEPTGTSTKFVNMMVQALESFQQEYAVSLDKITRIPLEGEGTIDRRVDKLYHNLTENQEWINDLHDADAIFVATHSQGSVVSTHLLNRLIHDQHIRTSKNTLPLENSGVSTRKPQRVCCLALCGIHLGPLRYLNSSTFVQPYLQYFESSAARELFEFQNTESAVSKSYVNALRHVLDNGVKMVYVASLNDQVVPIYSGLFTAISHPLILRALYIDGVAYHSTDFLSNLLVLLLRILNSGISDSGLLAHLSEATAGSLNGIGHSTAYEEISTYTLAVKYLFLTNDGLADHSKATLESFNANHERNDYVIPWALRDLIADRRVLDMFNGEIAALRDAFRDWHPRTSILRDLKRKLQPIQRLPPTFYTPNSTTSASKL